MPPPAGHLEFRGTLAPTDPMDRVRRGCHHVVYLVRMTAGKTYVIDLLSSGWDNYLRLETSNCQQIAENDDAGGNLNARIIMQAPQDGWCRVIVTSCNGNATGQYTLKMQQK